MMTSKPSSEDRAQASIDQKRVARTDRIIAGKADAFDCSSEDDVVCPHCGAWTTRQASDLELSQSVRDTIWHPLRCLNCMKEYMLRVETRYRFTTRPRDRDED